MKKPNTAHLQTPSDLLADQFCAARLPSGVPVPYYEQKDWSGRVQKAKLAYRPSGKTSSASIGLLLVVPIVTTSVGLLISDFVLWLFGWTSLWIEFILVGAGGLVGFYVAARRCRNRFVAASIGVISGVLIFFTWRWLGWLDSGVILERAIGRGELGSLGEVRSTEAFFLIAGFAFMGWWSVGRMPYCEKCNRPYMGTPPGGDGILTLNDFSPIAALYFLRRGVLPSKDRAEAHAAISALTAVPTNHSIQLSHFFCIGCGVGILSAKFVQTIMGQRNEMQFYSEEWRKDEVLAGERNDAPTLVGS